MTPAPQNPVRAATLCAALVVGAQVGGKALRDTLFLTAFPIRRLPTMVMAAAVLSLIAALWLSKALTQWGPRRSTRLLFLVSAALVTALWTFQSRAPQLVATLLYLHLSVFGALLISGLWSAVSEALDPRSARKHVGTIAAGSTAGGLMGGILAERSAAWAGPMSMFAVIIAAHVLGALACSPLHPLELQPEARSVSALESLRAISRHRYLIMLAAVVVLGTVVENLLDYLLKSQAAARYDEIALMRFFGIFYTGIGIATFLVQLIAGQRALDKLGPAGAATALPGVAFFGSLLLLLVPGFGVTVAARATQAVMRNSFFRSGYELFFAPLSAKVRRRAKTLVDVGADRGGDLVAGSIITALLWWTGQGARWLMATLALVLCALMLWLVGRLHRGYVLALETRLEDGSDGIFLTQTALHHGLLLQTIKGIPRAPLSAATASRRSPTPTPLMAVPDAASLAAMSTQDRIALLEDNALAAVVGDLLAADAAVDPTLLIAALLGKETPFVVRRRIPRILSRGVPSQVVPALRQALSDRRFEVRFQAAAVLYVMRQRGVPIDCDADTIHGLIAVEVAVDQRLWRARQSPSDDSATDLVEGLLASRVDRSMQHIFHLLALTHPSKPLRIAYRGLFTEDPLLRGTALEYLVTILPDAIWSKLRPLLNADDHLSDGANEPSAGTGRQALASLIKSHASIEAWLDRAESTTADVVAAANNNNNERTDLPRPRARQEEYD